VPLILLTASVASLISRRGDEINSRLSLLCEHIACLYFITYLVTQNLCTAPRDATFMLKAMAIVFGLPRIVADLGAPVGRH
jgi:hypothetical protein